MTHEGTSGPGIPISGSGILSDPLALATARNVARKAAELMRLPYRNRVWRGSAGEFLGSSTGTSIDFQDHRSYLPGDDPRHINWQAYARTGNYSMKLYREEVRPQVDVMFDVSRSMFVDDSKGKRSVELFLFGLDAAGHSGGAVNTWLVCGEAHEFVPDIERITEKWPRAAVRLQSANPDAQSPALHEIPLRADALRVLVSDLLFADSPDRLVSSLAASKGRGVILSPFSIGEAHPSWQGNYEFVDVEDRSRHLRRVEPALLERYRTAYANHFAAWKSHCTKHDVAFARVAAEPALEQALQAEGIAQQAVELAI